MADLSELLSNSDPDALQKLIDLRNKLNSSSAQAPYDAAEQAAQQSAPTSYDELFGKNAEMQQRLAPQDLTGKSAEESADVLKNAPEFTAAEKDAGLNAMDSAMPIGEEVGETGAAEGLLNGVGQLAGRALGTAAGIAIPSNAFASPSDYKQIPVPGMPGKYFQGQDIISKPDLTDDDKSLLSQILGTGQNSSTASKSDILADLQRNAPKSSDDDEEDTQGPALAGGVSGTSRGPMPAGSSSIGSPISAQNLSQKDVLGNLMNNLYGPGASDRLRSSQAAERQIMMGNALNMAGKEIAAGLSRGAYKPDYSSNAQIEKGAAIPVQQEMQQRAAVKDALDSGVKLSDFNDKQQLTDASSPLSQSYRSMAMTLVPQIAKTPGFENMSAEAIKQAQPMVDTYMKAQLLQLQRSALASKTEDQNAFRAYGQAKQQLESIRGNPAAAQAENNVLNAQKLQSLVNMYGDPNKLSPEMKHMAIMEAARIAQQGVPTEQEMKALDNGTVTGTLAKMWEKVSNSPAPANGGDFLKQYVDYSKKVAQDSQKYIQDRYGRIINTSKVAFKNHPEYGDALNNEYINRFKVDNSTTPYSPAEESGIQSFMQANGITDRNEAIKALKGAGRLK